MKLSNDSTLEEVGKYWWIKYKDGRNSISIEYFQLEHQPNCDQYFTDTELINNEMEVLWENRICLVRKAEWYSVTFESPIKHVPFMPSWWVRTIDEILDFCVEFGYCIPIGEIQL